MRIRLVPSAALALLALFAPSGRAPAQVLTFTHLAGGDGGSDAVDGAGSRARFNSPRGIALDAQGNVYVADSLNHTIRRITPEGESSTLAGMPGVPGSADGTAAEARFDHPYGVAVDGGGTVFVADAGNHTIRAVAPSGRVTTLAGLAGFAGADDGHGSAARFASPHGLAVDRDGTLWVADFGNSTIRRISREGDVTTLAGLACAPGFIDATGNAARFNNPTAISLETSGALLVADGYNNAIRRVTRDGSVTTAVGPDSGHGYLPGVVSDPFGYVYVVDFGAGVVRRFGPAGDMTVLAGFASSPWATWGSRDGQGPDARFNCPWALAVDAAGTLYVADSGNHLIRKVTREGDVSTLAGLVGAYGYADGAAGDARFFFPRQLAADHAGNVYVPDNGNHVIRKIAPDGTVTTLAGLAGVPGSADGRADRARFENPSGVAVDPLGNVLVADSGNQTIRKIAPDGTVTTVAGLAGAYASADGAGSAARFYSPLGIACDTHGNILVADTGNQTVRKIDPDGLVTTLAGAPGQRGSDDGPGSAARFSSPFGVAVDARGDVYVTDNFNGTIRKIAPDGFVTTLAGVTLQWEHLDGRGPAAHFYFPAGIVADASGALFVSDSWNQSIRKVTPGGDVSTVAGHEGSSWSFVCQSDPVEGGRADGSGPSARFGGPEGVAVGPDGSFYVADTSNHAIRVARPFPLSAVATVDSATGGLLAARALDGGNAVEWEWSVRRRPAGSRARLSDYSARRPTFAPDVPGVYVFALVARANGAASVSEVRFEALARLRAAGRPGGTPVKPITKN